MILTAERRGVILAEALDAGAAGWIGLDADLDEVDSTLRDVIAGRPIIGACRRAELLDLLRSERSAERRALSMFDELTPREIQVLIALTDGFSADQIARESFVSVATIRSQIRAVLRKLGVNSQLAAVAIASAHRDVLPKAEALGPNRRQSDRKIRSGEQVPPAATA